MAGLLTQQAPEQEVAPQQGGQPSREEVDAIIDQVMDLLMSDKARESLIQLIDADDPAEAVGNAIASLIMKAIDAGARPAAASIAMMGIVGNVKELVIARGSMTPEETLKILDVAYAAVVEAFTGERPDKEQLAQMVAQQ